MKNHHELSTSMGVVGALIGGSRASSRNGRLVDELAASPLSIAANSPCVTCARGGIEDDVKRRVAACIDVADYNKLPVAFKAAGTTYTNHGGSTVSSLMSYLASAAGNVVDANDRLNAWVGSLVGLESDSNAFLDGVTKEMTAKFATAAAAGAPFENYQKVCMAQCVASQIIKYASDYLSKFGGASSAVAEGVGVCTEFSAIAQRLIANTAGSTVTSWLGYSNSADSGESHAFVQVAFDGFTYSIEPQRDPRKACNCTFYK